MTNKNFSQQEGGHTSPGHPFFMIYAHNLPIQTFWFAHLGQLGPGETIRTYTSNVDSGKGVNFCLMQTLAKVNSAGRVTS